MARDIRESLDQPRIGRLQIGILSGNEAGANQAGLLRVQTLLTPQATKKSAGERQISPTPKEDHMICVSSGACFRRPPELVSRGPC
jgi:hypothetical protein